MKFQVTVYLYHNYFNVSTVRSGVGASFRGRDRSSATPITRRVSAQPLNDMIRNGIIA